MSEYITTETSTPMAIAMRITDLNGTAYDRDDVSEISYSIVLLGETDENDETAVTGHTDEALVVNDIIPDGLQNPDSWTEDSTGYNFRHFFATSPYTLDGRVYKTTYSITTSTVTLSVEVFVTTDRSRIAEGYCLQRDIEEVFGPANVRKWADLDNRGSDIGGRMAAAIAAVKNEIDDRLRGGPYLIPFVTVPETIKLLSAQLAGVWLYESRGIEDFDETTGQAVHKLSWYKKHVDQVLTQIMRGQRRLDATKAANAKGTRAPVVV